MRQYRQKVEYTYEVKVRVPIVTSIDENALDPFSPAESHHAFDEEEGTISYSVDDEEIPQGDLEELLIERTMVQIEDSNCG